MPDASRSNTLLIPNYSNYKIYCIGMREREGGKEANKKIPVNRDELICRCARYRNTFARYRLDDVKHVGVGNPRPRAINQGYSILLGFDRKRGISVGKERRRSDRFSTDGG